jgi:phage N-6-adenine-methyltransferase
MTMGSHQSSAMVSDNWLTPPEIIKALGEFDLDPCCPKKMPWATARRFYDKEANGLVQPWNGRIWLNPPYSREAVKWLAKLADHGRGTALIFARTETKWFVDYVWKRASGMLFIHGRVTFCDITGTPASGNSGAPSVLVAYGKQDAIILKKSNISGTYFDNTPTQETPETC